VGRLTVMGVAGRWQGRGQEGQHRLRRVGRCYETSATYLQSRASPPAMKPLLVELTGKGATAHAPSRHHYIITSLLP